PSQQQNSRDDLALAGAIRNHVQYDTGLAPSLTQVTIVVKDEAVTLQGNVKSEMDARVIADDLLDVPGVTVVRDNLEITPDWD
ncbi:MAG TPA: BON domain-containing protein, partial [Verrucomicrobiae bacterium]|nr:BON domain-containing protein [Verrucomicrobiae bacterium]